MVLLNPFIIAPKVVGVTASTQACLEDDKAISWFDQKPAQKVCIFFCMPTTSSIISSKWGKGLIFLFLKETSTILPKNGETNDHQEILGF